jgi:hypothetical protein
MTTGIRDFTLLLPPGWARIPLDERIPLRIKQLVDQRLSGAPVEHRKALRTGLTRELTDTLTRARRQGGLDVLLSLDPVARTPVPASALVTHLGAGGDGAVLDPLLGTLVSGGPGLDVVELGVVEVAGASAVRRRASRTEQVLPQGDLPGGVLRVTQLEYFVPLPGGGGLLVLAFSTPIAPLAEALVGLFDVVAASLRWVRS